jgi:putative Mg2+ transporter-C (MgtC) family protein
MPLVDPILNELTGFLPTAAEAARVLIRLVAAVLAGAVIGLQRERAGKAAGLRTHMLVCMGTALFVIASAEADLGPDALSRVIQGIVTGIGFLGAGAIMKQEATREIRGLTTAAGIWMTAAIGVSIGLGRLGTAMLGVLLAWIVLAALLRVEGRVDGSSNRA